MEKQRVSPGLYRVYWKTGRASLVSIGMGADGEMWFAPTNWIAPETRIPWEQIKSYEKLDIEKDIPDSSNRECPTLAFQNNDKDVDLFDNHYKWLEDKVETFMARERIPYSDIIRELMAFIKNGGKKYPYIDGDKLIFDASDKATHAAVHEYAKASVYWGHGSEEFVGEKCNDLLRKISKLQKEE